MAVVAPRLIVFFVAGVLAALFVYAAASYVRPLVSLVLVVIVHGVVSSVANQPYWSRVPGTIMYNSEYDPVGWVDSIFFYQVGVIALLAAVFFVVKVLILERREVSF